MCLTRNRLDQRGHDNDPDFDPEKDLRDYQKLQDSLQVFCVSSRAFQKLRDPSRHDGLHSFAGFQDEEDTEIPQLQAHLRALSEKRRRGILKNFLVGLERELNSMEMRISGGKPLIPNTHLEGHYAALKKVRHFPPPAIG